MESFLRTPGGNLQPVPAHRFSGFIRLGSLECQGAALAGTPITAEDTKDGGTTGACGMCMCLRYNE